MFSATIGVFGLIFICVIVLCVQKNTHYTEEHWKYLQNNKKSIKCGRDYLNDYSRYL